MALKDLHVLPKVRDCTSHIYLEHGWVDQQDQSIAFHDKQGVTAVPAASLAVLMLGPGTNVTHAAIRTLADNNCLVVWCGEENVRFYAQGMGGTRGSEALLYQAWLASDPRRRMEVVLRMYKYRFGEEIGPDLSLEQIRGKEAARVRAAYARAAAEHGIEWTGRSYDRTSWSRGDPANRALSCANSCLYGVCHAAILSIGLSPAIGFVHTGKQLSFVYDVADLYKTEITIPLAFKAVAERTTGLDREVRLRCRDAFRESRLLNRIVPDIRAMLGDDPRLSEGQSEFDEDPAAPVDWWSPEDDGQAQEQAR